MLPPHRDRRDAGRRLAERLAAYRDDPRVLVLGLAGGGVVVAREVAYALGAPLDVLVVRRLAAPGRPELTVGAVAGGGVRVLNEHLVRLLRIAPDALARLTTAAAAEVDLRQRALRGDRAPLDPAGRVVLLVDEGLASAATMAAATDVLRPHAPARVVVAAPVAAPGVCAELQRVADGCVCPLVPNPLVSVERWYTRYPAVTDGDVRRLLAEAAGPSVAAASPA